MAPTIANNKIIEVIINHILYVVYITFPIVVMWLVSAKLPSHILLVTKDISPMSNLFVAKLNTLLKKSL
jgi:ribosomal protein S3AE